MDAETTEQVIYPIEISGWNVNGEFFVERAELRWNDLGEKRISLRETVRDGAVVFARLMSRNADSPAVPIAYQAELVPDQRSRGTIEMKLVPCQPRSSELEHTHSAEEQLHEVGVHEK
jgi:hypothetical protein